MQQKQIIDINYIILDYSEIDKVNFDEILITSIDTLRLNNDGTKTFIKWIGDEPTFVSELVSKSIIYNNEEILIILEQPEWVAIPPISGTTIN
jgi:hypothetical protein